MMQREPDHERFHQHDGAVDDDAEVHGTERDEVGRHPLQVHEGEGEEQGQRDDRSHHQGGPPFAQENHQHRYHQQGAGHQVFAHRVDGMANQVGALVDGFDADALGQLPVVEFVNPPQ